MNIFFIPSWYSSPEHPLAGIFSKEQAIAMSRHYPDCSIGLSLWGQKNESNLLWAEDHVKNIRKLLHFPAQKPYDKDLSANFHEYFTPALTWTDKFLQGNIKNIIAANEQNLQRFCRKAGPPTLIHAHVAFPAGYVAMQLAEKYELPYLITEQMSPFPFACYTTKGKIMPKVLRPLQRAHAVVAISPAAAYDLEQKTGTKPVVIPNLVDEDLFSPAEELPEGPFTFFTLGRMVPQKGIPDLLRAISLLTNKDARFVLGGSGEEHEQYQQLAKTLKIEDRLRWIGALNRTEAAREFRRCHAFVLPSIHESMGVVYAEAIACGKPVIASRCGGPEFIVNNENGLLVDPHAPQQLASAMEQMMEHYHRYHAGKIRNDFMNRFSSGIICKKIRSLYQAVVLNQPLPSELFPRR